MSVPLVRRIEIEQSELVTARQHAKLARLALGRVATYHVRVRMQDLKFSKNSKTAPGGAYGYRKRGKKYLRDKLRKGRGDDPWSFTGRSKRYMKRFYRITKTQRSATLYIKSRFRLRPEFRQELEAIAPDETQEMNVQAHQFYLEEAQKPENRRKRRRSI